MKRKNDRLEKLFEIIDKIFLLNHNIVSQMIKSLERNNDNQLQISPIVFQKIEEKSFNKLSVYFKNLREEIIEVLKRDREEILASQMNPYYIDKEDEDDDYDNNYSFKEEEWGELLEAIKDRLDKMFISMDFVRKKYTLRNSEMKLEASIYDGKMEESLREQEYIKLIEAISIQFYIINFEAFFKKHIDDKNFIISPSISPVLISAVSDDIKFSAAEVQCAKYIKYSNEQVEELEKHPELKDTTEQVRFMFIEEQYKRKMNKYTGYLNNEVSYSKMILYLYKNGLFPKYSNFDEEEINLIISTRVGEYLENNKQKIRTIFNNNVQKYEIIRQFEEEEREEELAKLNGAKANHKRKKRIKLTQKLKNDSILNNREDSKIDNTSKSHDDRL